jgi:hypothetical protein
MLLVNPLHVVAGFAAIASLLGFELVAILDV